MAAPAAHAEHASRPEHRWASGIAVVVCVFVSGKATAVAHSLLTKRWRGEKEDQHPSRNTLNLKVPQLLEKEQYRKISQADISAKRSQRSFSGYHKSRAISKDHR
jgi:hypothetical protein